MSWNYRVVKTQINGEPVCAIHEVYYDKVGGIVSVTVEPARPIWSIEESGQDVLQKMIKAFEKDVIDLDTLEYT